ncbi:coagulation factor VIII [Bombina bombina]|uniref:coagulation factor VIII n=1 Tax=Bombina bombina TaxID=8345 RepID=UPI00235A9B66|nr:coagulation factor VIII [Bombina bombina]
MVTSSWTLGTKMCTLSWFILVVLCHNSVALTRTYYIAARELDWDYKDSSLLSALHRQKDGKSLQSGLYRKVVYVEYTDASFEHTKPRPDWTGLLGPTIRAEMYDTIIIHFKNLASRPYSVHGVGVSYGKSSEGVGYRDGTSQSERADDAVASGKEHIYIWNIPESYGPTLSDPPCVTSAYYSHSNSSHDMNAGLVGPIIICRPGSLSEDGSQQGTQEKILLFAVFDENNSPNKTGENEDQVHTINGYTNRSLPEMVLCHRKPVTFHIIGFGSHSEVHSISLEGHSFVMSGHRVSNMPVTAFTFITASTQPGESGVYNLSCQTPSHPAGRMAALVRVEVCTEEPKKQMRKSGAYDYEEEDDEYYDSIVLELDEDPSPLRIRSSGKLRPVTWTHYIAAVEVEWDYRPSSKERTKKSFRYTKAVYREFTDSSFLHQKESELPGTGILGPVLRGEVGDQIKIVFKNLAHHPYNMYPEGIGSVSSELPHLTGEQLKDHPVYPKESVTYIWHVTQHDAPTSSDRRCLTRFYSSSLDPKRDLASGLIGPLLICKKQTLDQRGNQVVTNKERLLVFSLFDESISWYIERNLQKIYGNISENHIFNRNAEKLKPMHTVNGLMDSLHLSLCLNEVNLWHLLSLGLDTELLSIYFGGNTFRTDSGYQDTLTLFPQSGETIEMVIEIAGQWTVAPLDPSVAALGMRASLSVSECYLIEDGIYEYDYEELYDNQPYINPRGIPVKRPHSHRRKIPQERKINKEGHNQNTSIPQWLHVTHKNLKSNIETQKIREETGNLKNETQTDESVKQKASEKWKLEAYTKDLASGKIEQGMEMQELELGRAENESGREEEKMGIKERMSENIKIRMKTDKPKSVPEDYEMRREDTDSASMVQGNGMEMSGTKRVEREEPVVKRKFVKRETRNSVTGTEESGEYVAEIEEALNVTLNSEPLGYYHNNMEDEVQVTVPTRDERSSVNNISATGSRDLNGETEHTSLKNHSTSGFYDDYSITDTEDIDMYGEQSDKDPRSPDEQLRTYYIAAVEVMWDYGAGNSPYFIRKIPCVSEGFPQYKKVVFREYLDIHFTEQATRGERDAHLGLLGPYIRAEINDAVIIHFKNMASRPYSFYSNILNLKGQTEEVPPQQTRTYTGRVSAQLGPTETGSECRAWLYTSNVHSNKDLHSGLVGPFLACRPHVLSRSFDRQLSVQDFSLTFMEIDETQSWYLSDTLQQQCPLACTQQGPLGTSCPQVCNSQDPDFQRRHTFYAINGHVGDTLPGLILPLHQKVRWHLVTVGTWEILTVQFHGNILTSRDPHERRLNLHSLYPGVLVTLEMVPQSVGAWRVESEGKFQDCGLTALYIVYDRGCRMPLGLSSGKIKDSQISSSGYYDSWGPSLARLDNSGSINAWSVENVNSWIQVDLLTPTLVHAVHTQGARHRLTSLYISQFVICYSLDGEFWHQYQGNASANQMVFFGNVDASTVRENVFDPPFIARYFRLHPTHTGPRAALRMELLGCDISSCSLPLGLQSGTLTSKSLSASSYLNSVFSSWEPNLARLNQRGRVNAWRPRVDTPGEWLQLDFGHRMKVTGLLIQGARSGFSSMFITQFSLSTSDDGKSWEPVRGVKGKPKIFQGSQDTDTPFWVTLGSPFIKRYLRVHPESWKGGIALRMEVLGCESS